MDETQIKKNIITLFIKRIDTEKIKWPRGMKNNDKIKLLNNLLIFAEDHELLDSTISIGKLKQELERK